MKRITILVAIFAFASIKAFSQNGVDIVISPNITFNKLNHGSEIYSNAAFDSIVGLHKTRYSLGFELSFVHNINRDMLFQAGLRYNNTGFSKVVKDLQFHDSIHPEIGRIEDLSTAASKDATLNYNISYLELPLRLSYRISQESKLFKYGIYLSGGVIMQYRITDFVNINLTGFSIDNETHFKGKKSHIRFNNFNAGPVIGVRGKYRISKDLWVMAKPEFYFPIGDVSDDRLRYRLFQFSGNVGINYTID